MQQLRAHVLDVVAEFSMSETVCGESVNDAERIAELIIEPRSNHADRKRMAHVADAFANMVPDVRDFLGARAILEIDEDRGHPGACETAQEIEIWRFLHCAFKPLRDLLEHVANAGAWPCSLDHHGLDDERRVFVAPEPH